MNRKLSGAAIVAAGLLAAAAGQTARGNGGPFVVKYPSGDPAAKGVLARLDPSLQPAREMRLRVVEEKLTIGFDQARFGGADSPPLAAVAAHYTIENPTAATVPMDFGFPVLRGIYMSPFSMMPRPEVTVTVDGKPVPTQIISNSLIYAIIRQRAREAIERGVTADAKLAALVAPLRPATPPAPVQPPAAAQQAVQQAAPPAAQQAAPALPPPPPAAVDAWRAALGEYLTTKLQWNARDAALMVEYAAMDFGPQQLWPHDRWMYGFGAARDDESRKLLAANLGPLAAIGEQKATQFFAQLAGRFDRQAAAEYEAVFRAWGGEVRERSLDLGTGQVRPREFELPKDTKGVTHSLAGDVTVFARLDYLDESNLPPAQKEACRNVLKNLPVVFTFAPMNLIYYQVEFAPKARREVVVSYLQYAYIDSRQPASYQLAYVLHPASLWESFGPIRLAVSVPEGIGARASVAWTRSAPPPAQTAQANAPAHAAVQTAAAPKSSAGVFSADLDIPFGGATAAAAPGATPAGAVYRATLTEPAQKTGELFIALDKAAWDQAAKAKLDAEKAKLEAEKARANPGANRSG